MGTVFKVFKGHSFLGGRGSANAIRREVEHVLSAGTASFVVLDFSGVSGVSHSFTDELLAPLSEQFERLDNRLYVFNCDDAVRDALEVVCQMHHLQMPGFMSDDAQMPASERAFA